jgi:hypothetical protein
MTEMSFLWTTGGAGDGASTYTRADWSNIASVFGGCGGWEGICSDYLNDLVGSVPAANTARIASGGAVVDGKPYKNDANVDVNIPSAVGGGNTRIDRIVLRAGWTAQMVRITRIPGTDAGSPVAPAITQTPGTTYDIMLYQALVDTSGTVTLTDERVFGQSGINSIKADAVDDTRIGNRVPQLYRRQGGSATNWDTQGTTTYTPTAVRMQCGVARWTGSGVDWAVFNVTLPVAFSYKFIVFVQSITYANICAIGYVAASPNEFTIYWHDFNGNTQTQLDFQWLAIGPE